MRVTGLRRFHRGGLDTVTEAAAGQVVVLRGLDTARIGDGFGAGAPFWPSFPPGYFDHRFLARPAICALARWGTNAHLPASISASRLTRE